MNAGLKLLLVEDHALVRNGMRLLMEQCEPGMVIVEAARYDDAMAAMHGQSFDIAFLDILLGGGPSGLDLLREMRRLGIDTRVIMLTGVGDERILGQCLRFGAKGCISKSEEDPGIFSRAIREALRGGTFVVNPRGAAVGSQATGSLVDDASVAEMGLSKRVLETLYHICQGLSNRAIAERMGIQVKTIENDYNPLLFRAFGVTSRAALIVEATRRGIARPE